MPLFIEIIGSPGSGKTTVSKELLKLLNKNNFRVYHTNNIKKYKQVDKNYNLFIKIILFFETIKYLFQYLIKLNKNIFIKKNNVNNYFFRMFKLYFIHTYNFYYLKNKCKENEIIIIEPGPVMFLLHDYFYSNFLVNKQVVTITDKLFIIDIIFNLECAKKTSYKRINQRKTGPPLRMKNMNKEKMMETLDNSKKNINNYILYTSKKIEIIDSEFMTLSEITNKLYTKLISLNIKKVNQ